MRILLAIASALLGAVVALPCRAASVSIVDHGIYQLELSGVRRPSESDPTGFQESYVAAKQTEETDNVCARLGLAFGFRFIVSDDARAGALPVTSVVRYPPPGITNARKVTYEKAEYREVVAVGARASFFYSFDERWEMVAGEWTLEVQVDGQVLTSRTFTISTACGTS